MAELRGLEGAWDLGAGVAGRLLLDAFEATAVFAYLHAKAGRGEEEFLIDVPAACRPKLVLAVRC